LRKARRVDDSIEFFSARRSEDSIARCDIAILVLDAESGIMEQDKKVAGKIVEEKRACIVIVNKWDLVIGGNQSAGRSTKAARMRDSKRPADRSAYEERLRDALKFLNYAPVLFVSAATGVGTEKIFPELEHVASERRKRIGTGEINRFIKQVDFDRASVPARQQVKIYYMTQASVAPPTFVLFTDRQVKLHFSYQRFIENQLRRAFGFVGTPIWIKNRSRD